MSYWSLVACSNLRKERACYGLVSRDEFWSCGNRGHGTCDHNACGGCGNSESCKSSGRQESMRMHGKCGVGDLISCMC